MKKKRAEKAWAAGVFHVALLGRRVQVLATEEGLRAVGKDQKPSSPESVGRVLESKFAEAFRLPANRRPWHDAYDRGRDRCVEEGGRQERETRC